MEVKNLFFLIFIMILTVFTGCDAKADKSKEFARMAVVSLMEENDEGVKQAKKHIEKACKIKPYGQAYGFLKARILLSDNAEAALAQYESSFKNNREYMTSDDARLYMALLADYGKDKECLEVLEYYTEHFPYFHGFGQFASSVYEKNGKYFESVLSAFLDYEYHSCFLDDDEEKEMKNTFMENMEKLEKNSEEKDEIKEGIKCIKAIYDSDAKSFPEIQSDFYVYKYLRSKFHIQTGTFDAGTVEELVMLEKYFSVFPIYYWNVYLSAKKLGLMQTHELLAVLEKTVATAPSSKYASRISELL